MPDTLPSGPATSPVPLARPHCSPKGLWRHSAPYLLPCVGLLLILFLESQYFVIKTPVQLPFMPNTTVPLTPLAYMCVAWGALISGIWLSARRPIAASLQTSALFWLACGTAGALCHVGAALWPAEQVKYILASALTLGWCLPPVIYSFFGHTSFVAHALVFTCATSLGEMTSIGVHTFHLSPLRAGIVTASLILVGVIAGWTSRKSPVDFDADFSAYDGPAKSADSAPQTAPNPSGFYCTRKTTQAITLLVGFAVLFFGVHSMHDDDFNHYSTLRTQIPLWVHYALLLTFPLLGLLAIRFGLISLAFMTVGLNAFHPVLDTLQHDPATYSIVFSLDSIATHGGTIFITLACMQLAPRVTWPKLCCALPFILLNASYGGFWLVHSIVQWQRPTVYILSVAFVAVLTPALAILHRSMYMLPQHTPPTEIAPSPPINTADFAIAKGLSPREAEVFALMLQGLSYADMGNKLFISEATVKVHAGRIFKKSGAKTRAQLMSTLFYTPPAE